MTAGAEGVEWDGPQGKPLRLWLELAVPIALADLARRGGPSAEDYATAPEAAKALAEKGDRLMFGGRKGEAGALAALLARRLAILAYSPGGVTFAGLHWEVVIETPAGAIFTKGPSVASDAPEIDRARP